MNKYQIAALCTIAAFAGEQLGVSRANRFHTKRHARLVDANGILAMQILAMGEFISSCPENPEAAMAKFTADAEFIEILIGNI